jgi:translation elongation factor EF-4
MPFAETSAKSGQNVNEIFENLIERVVNNSENKSQNRPKLKPPQPLANNRKG